MPDKWPLANGNWSNASNWNGGTKPVAGDDVFSDNRTLTVDESFNVATLRSTARSGGTAGGTFVFSVGNISGSITAATPTFTIGNTANIIVTANTGLIRLIFSSGSSIGHGSQWITYSGNCDLSLEGNPNIFNPTSANGGQLIVKTSSGRLTIIGNLLFTAPFVAGGSNCIILFSSAGDSIINGNIQGPTQGSTNRCIELGNGNLTINGNITGGTNSQNAIVFNGTNMSVSGSVAGSSGGIGIVSTTGAVINITGSILAGSANPAISLSGASTLICSGSIAASAGSPAIISTSTSATNIFTGPFINNGSVMAVQAARMFLATGSTYWEITSEAIGVSQSLYTADQIPTYPSTSDVRLGTTYASGSLTGTLAMPAASSVQFGVPIDNTTGSAVLTTGSLASAIWDRQRSSLVTTGSIGERLSNVATPATIGNQISSYLL